MQPEVGLRTGRITGTAAEFTGPTGGTEPQTGRVWREGKLKRVGSGTKRPSTVVDGRFFIENIS
jgi:hypothetical protein